MVRIAHALRNYVGCDARRLRLILPRALRGAVLGHGWATKELTRLDMEHSEAPIRAAVKSVLSTFPPQA